MSTGNCVTSDSIQDGDIDGRVANPPPSAAGPEQERPDRNDASPTTQTVLDPPNDSGSQPTQVALTQPAHEIQESIGDPTEASQHHQDTAQDTSEGANANIDTECAPASDAPALRVEEDSKGDCYAYVEVPEESASNTIQKDGLPSRLLFGKRTFALRKTTEAQKRARIAQATEPNSFTDRYDYLKKYPADPSDEGMGPNARVWRVYLDEVEQFDIDMVDNFRDTVDVMLVFAGLFSAVVTTFVAQASTALQLDYTQVAASAALEQLALSRAFYSGSPIPDPSSSTLSFDSSTTTAFDRWVNGLWFTSLSLSLATALFAVLIKQWIQAYVSPVSGTPQERARIRQYRYLGLERWHIYGIIGLLPTLLHLSLFLFLAGLAVFLFSLDHTIAKVTASIAGSAATIYIFSNVAPVFDSQCPYKTPLSNYVLVLLHPLVLKSRAPFRSLRARLQIMHRTIATALRKLLRSVASSPYLPRKLAYRLEGFLERSPMDARSSQRSSASGFIKKVELEDINLISDGIDAEALCWVVTWSSNPSVRTVVVEAVGDLRIGYEEPAKDILRDGGVADAACASLEACTKWVEEQPWKWKHVRPGMESLHFRSSLVHFQLGWCLFSTLDGVHMKKGTARHVPCIYDPNYAEGPSHQDVDRRFGPYFALLLEPSWELISPQHMLQSLLPGSPKIVFLLSLRRAALYLRSSSPPRSQCEMVDWPSCQKLFALVQLEPPPADLFSLWQTTLVSVYLASLGPVAAPIPEHSGLLPKLLFNHIKLGSSELSQGLAIDLSQQSCMEFFAHTLKDPTAFTDFSSSDAGRRFIEHLRDHFDRHQPWVSYSDRHAIGPHHTLLVALLDLSEKHGASMSTKLRTIIYQLGYNLMSMRGPRSSELGPDLASLYERLLRAALIPPQLSEPYKLMESQIVCLRVVLRGSPPESRSSLTEVFRVYDGITTLDKIIQYASLELDAIDRRNIELSLESYLRKVSPTGENSPPSPETDMTHHGGQSDADSQCHLGYILRHLVQVISICVAGYFRRISHSEYDSHPDTLHILRRIIKTQPEVSPEWNLAFAELETWQGKSLLRGLGVVDRTLEDVEHNLNEILSILRSDLEAARSPGVQNSLHSVALLPQSLISEVVEIEPGPSLDLGPTVEEEIDHPPTPVESLISRSARQLKAAVRGVVATRRRDAVIPLHNRTPLQPVRESEPAAGDASEEKSSMARRDEEDGLPATDTSATATREPHERAWV